jgi:E3 ubiquitin-protein ligase RNF14
MICLVQMTYHGVAPCRLQSSKFKELRSSYLAADTQGKEFFEKRYGKAMIRRIFEEHQSETYMEDNCKRCPACKANVSKVDGCNKMTCGHCRRAFCWLCCAVLPTTNPYFHFNAPGGACYNKLFEGVDDNSDDDNDDDEVWEPVLNRFQEEDDDDFVVFANVGD